MTTRRPPTTARTDTRLDQLLDGAILAGLTVLILVGFTTSYRTLRNLAATLGGYPEWLAPAVPLSFDLGIVVLSLKVARAAREGRTAPFLRLLVGALSATTVVANASAATTWTAAILHAVPPAMFVICFESVIVSVRRHALNARGLLPQPLPRLGTARWLLAPRTTWISWRRLVLADETVPVRDSSPLLGASASQAAQQMSSPTSTPSTGLPSGLDRLHLVRALLNTNPGMSTKDITAALASQGHVISIRTAQRLRVQAETQTQPGIPESPPLRAIRV